MNLDMLLMYDSGERCVKDEAAITLFGAEYTFSCQSVLQQQEFMKSGEYIFREDFKNSSVYLCRRACQISDS